MSEGATISAGQAIARMGSTGTDSVKLHFEIRRRGKPIDPLKVLRTAVDAGAEEHGCWPERLIHANAREARACWACLPSQVRVGQGALSSQ